MNTTRMHIGRILSVVVAITLLMVGGFYFLLGVSNATSPNRGADPLTPTATVTVEVPTTFPPITIFDTVTLPPVTVTPPAQTLTVPGPTQRVTRTETVTGIPRPTKTVTVRPNTITRSASPTDGPRATVTETQAGQTFTESVTIAPTPDMPDENTDDSNPTNTETVIKNVGFGILVILAALGLAFLFVLLSYWLGQKNREREENRFLEAILNRAKISRD